MKKRLSSLVLALVMGLVLTVPALAAELSVQWLTVAGEPYAYNETFGWITLKGDDGSYRMVDRTTLKRAETYDYCSEPCGDYAVVGKSGNGGMKYGCIDKNKKVVIPLEYDAILRYMNSSSAPRTIFPDGLAIVGKADQNGVMKYGAVDKSGRVVIPLTFDFLYAFGNDRAPAGRNVDGGTKFGYVDKTGKVVVPLEYDTVQELADGGNGCFDGGVSAVGKSTDSGSNGNWGCVDKTGKIIIPIEYDNCPHFYDDRAVAVRNAGDGKFLYAVYDKTGRVIVPEGRYDWISDFSEGLAEVSKTGSDGSKQYGYIDPSGKEVIPLEYSSAGSFSNGRAVVSKENAEGNRSWSFIDKTGKAVLILNDNYSYVVPFGDDLLMVTKANAYGYIDKTGKAVVPVKYTGASMGFHQGIAEVQLDGKWGAFNAACSLIVPLEYENIYSPAAASGVILVEKKAADGSIKKGCYSQDGKLVIPVEYDSIGESTYQAEGRAYLLFPEKRTVNGALKRGVFDSTGRVLLPVEYDKASCLDSTGRLGWVKQGNRYGIFERP